MRAVVAPEPGGADALQIVELPDPAPGPGEVVLAVEAAALNRADILQREGRYPPPAGTTGVLGLEAAGTVALVGDGVSDWVPGDRAMALLAGGGYAERAVVPAPQLMPIPEPLDTVTAAAIPEVFLTAWMGLARLARLAPGEIALIHAGASGVGTAAIQVARELGATVVATSRAAARLSIARELGAMPVEASGGEFASAVRECTTGRGADVVLDLVGAAYWSENVDVLAPGGRIVMLSLTSGARADVDFGRLLPLQATIHCATLRARSVDQKADIIRDFGGWGLSRLAGGALIPVIDSVFPLEHVRQAHQAMESGDVVGKVLLTTGVTPAP
ncbi:MAG: NAD(P)H-quinone oxidoreductase [Thermoleophilia bacterium]|nr:NAD(P)H-quinone oxidoreductase [Thermoleophilia bacterium]